jgi:hypothetical protein
MPTIVKSPAKETKRCQNGTDPRSLIIDRMLTPR